MDGPQPLFLLADSQLLFPRAGEARFMARVQASLQVEPARAKAAYLGASNGDRPEFYELFEAAMNGIGVVSCQHVRARPDASAQAFLAEADVILLAGGDVATGWRAFEEAGLVEVLRSAPARGAVLIGVSAGAVQMGTCGPIGAAPLPALLSLLSHAIDAHDEPDWKELEACVRQGRGQRVGIGIPAGGGVIAHGGGRLEPFGKPLTELVWTAGGVKRTRQPLL